MNLIELILIIALLFGLSDFFTDRYPHLQRGIYYVALFTVTFLFTIKYYYGPDIAQYVPFYTNPPTIHEALSHPDDIRYGFEPGFAVFCRILSDLGISFYWMTAFVSLFYFGAIALLFRHIERKQAFALAILVIMDYRCIFATYRQCLAVACFVLMVLCLRNKRYLLVVLLAILTAVFHKSGIFVVAVVLFYYMVRGKCVKPYVYQLLLLALVLVFLLPIVGVSSDFIQHLPLPDSYIYSLKHHLSLGRQVQSVFLVYAVTLVGVSHFAEYNHSRSQAIAAAALVGLVIVAVLYQYYYLLDRLRSYFLPVVIVFVFRLVQSTEDKHLEVPYGTLAKQLCSLVLVIYLVHSILFLHRGTQQLKNNVYASCTVFELIDHRPSDVQNSQMKLAQKYWKEDFMANPTNKIRN